MNPTYRHSIISLFACFITFSMLFSTIPPELGAKYDQRYTTTNESFTLDFDETFYYESAHSVFGGPEVILEIDTIASSGYWDIWDWGICKAIQTFATSSWDCTDLDDSSDICSQHWSDGCYLEHEEYTVDLEFVYEYEIRHFGSATFEVETIWTSGSAPSSTVTMVSSTEDYVVGAKAYLELEVKRIFVGNNSNYGTQRNSFPVELPFLSPTDIDGGGNTMTIGDYELYVWDDYVTFFDESGDWSDAFGNPGIELDGSIPLAEIDLLEYACEWLEDLGSSLLPVCMALNYIIEVNFVIELDFEVDIKTWVQTFLGTDSISSISSIYNSNNTRIGYANWLSSPNSAFTTGVSGSGSDVNGIMGLHHVIETGESYSTSIYIEPTDNYLVPELWEFISPTEDYIQIPLTTGMLPSSSSGSVNLLTDEYFTADAPSGSGSGGGGSNSPPDAVLSFDSTSQSYVQIEAGDSVTLTTEGTSDADGDSLDWTISWGDGSSNSQGSSPPDYTTSHTYTSPGTYSINAGVTDGLDYSYPDALTVYVSERAISVNFDIQVYPDLLAYVGESVTLDFTVTSDESDIVYCLWDGGSSSYHTCVESSDGDLDFGFDTNYEEGDFEPAIHVFDSVDTWNYLGSYSSVEITVVPDTSNDNFDPSNFEIVGEQILIVVDDDGSKLFAQRTPEPHENSNNSYVALVESLAVVSGIRGVDFDMMMVGDTDWDNLVDTLGADGPGLDFLADYSTVVWTTGNSWLPTNGQNQPLTDQDQAVLRAYVEAGGSLVMFSQDLLFGECNYCSYWDEGTFARDVFGVRSSIQDRGEPVGSLSGLSGEGEYNLQYLPLAGLGSIEISNLNSSSYQDSISTSAPSSPMTQGFEYSNDLREVEFEDGLGDWILDNSTSTEGFYSATSGGGQGHDQVRDVYAYLDSASNYTSVSFDLNVSSEAGYDWLIFYIDDTLQDSWSGNVPWQRVSFNISTGSHTLKWSYYKDSSVSEGQDMAWIDKVTFCCTLPESGDYALDILSDEDGNNFAVVKMHNGGGRAALYTMDPVQIDNRYDLETMLMQFIDWSENEFYVGSSLYPASSPIGLDASHPAPTTTGGVGWFQSRLFAGQNVRIASSMFSVWGDDFDVQALEVTSPSGGVFIGTHDSSTNGKAVEFQAIETGTYLISVDITMTGNEWSVKPWFKLSVTHLIDDNDVWLASPTPIAIDGPAVADVLAPQNWATQVGGDGFDYSNSAFLSGSLTQGEHYGLGILSLDTARSPDLQIYFMQNDIVVDSASSYLDGGELHTQLVVPDITGPYEIQIFNLDEYGNPHLETFSYSVQMWSLPDCEPGTYQDSSGLAVCIEAPPGSYANDPSATSATVCPPGTYQPASGQASCIDAAGGHYVQDEGSTSQTPCPAGTYNPSVGATSVDVCIVTPAGGYSTEGSASYDNCPAGTYGPSTGATSDSVCIQVSPGQYSEEGSPTPVNCLPGTYQPSSGQSSCLGTTPGHYTSDAGQSEQIPAPLDEYVVGTASSSTQDCPPSHITLQVGADSEEDCYLDSDGDRSPDYDDNDDDNDGVTDDNDAFPKDASETIDTDGDGVGDNVDSDDDDDGHSDATEMQCNSEPLSANSVPTDIDGDGVCDAIDADNTDGPDYVKPDEGGSVPGFGLISALAVLALAAFARRD